MSRTFARRDGEDTGVFAGRIFGTTLPRGFESERVRLSRMKISRFIPNRTPCGHTRREFLWQVGGGFAGLALADLLAAEARAAGAASPLATKPSHFPAKAKHCVF